MGEILYKGRSELLNCLIGQEPWENYDFDEYTFINEDKTLPCPQPQTSDSKIHETPSNGIVLPPTPKSPVLPWKDEATHPKSILTCETLWKVMTDNEFQKFNYWLYKLNLMNYERKITLSIKNDEIDDSFNQHIKNGTIYELYYYHYDQIIENQMQLAFNSNINSKLNLTDHIPKFIDFYDCSLNMINQYEKFEFINLSFGDFILKYDPLSSDLLIFDSSMKLSTDLRNLSKIYKENLKQFIFQSQIKGCEVKFDEFRFEINVWDLIDLKIKEDHIFLIHPNCVTIVRIFIHSSGSINSFESFNSTFSPNSSKITTNLEKMSQFQIKFEILKTIPSPLFQKTNNQYIKDNQLPIKSKDNDNTKNIDNQDPRRDILLHITDVEFEKHQGRITLFHSNGTLIQIELALNLVGQRTTGISSSFNYLPIANIDEFYEPQYGRLYKLDKKSSEVLIYSDSKHEFTVFDLETKKTNKSLRLNPIKINGRIKLPSDIAIEENDEFEDNNSNNYKYSKVALKYEDRFTGESTLLIMRVDKRNIRDGYQTFEEIKVPTPELSSNVYFGNPITRKPVSPHAPMGLSFFKIYKGNLYNFTRFKNSHKMNIWCLKDDNTVLVKSWTLFNDPAETDLESCETFSYNFRIDMIAFMFTSLYNKTTSTFNYNNYKRRIEIYELSTGKRLAKFKIEDSIEFRCVRRIGLTKERIYLQTSTNDQLDRFIDNFVDIKPGNSILKVLDFGLPAFEIMMGKDEHLKKKEEKKAFMDSMWSLYTNL